MKKFEYCGFWCRNPDVVMIRKDGKVYALDGWNGEKYSKCWECVGEFNLDVGEKYAIWPILEETENGDFEIVDFEIDTYYP